MTKYDLMTSETLIVPIDQVEATTPESASMQDEQSSYNASADEAMQTMQHVSLTSSENTSVAVEPTTAAAAVVNTVNTIVRKPREESDA